MNTIKDASKQRLYGSIEQLILRILDNANIEYEDIEPHILKWWGLNSAKAADILDKTSRKITTVSDTYDIASKAIEEWVGATPGALDTLAELAQAFHNDPDIINKVIAMIAQKVDKSEFMRLTIYPNCNFEDQFFDPLMTWNQSSINMFPGGIYTGVCNVSRLHGLKDTYNEVPDIKTVHVEATVTTLQTVDVTATQGQVDFNINHDGWTPSKIEVNGSELPNWDVDVRTDPTILTLILSDGELPDGAAVKFTFVSGAPISEANKITNVVMTASVGGTEFKRGYRVEEGQILEEENMMMNVWTSPSMDNIGVYGFLATTFEDFADKIANDTLEDPITPPQ